jgi:hypothetical protein
MTPQQENLAIDLSAAFDVAAQGLLDAWRIEDPATRLALVERAIAYTLVRAAIESTRDDRGSVTSTRMPASVAYNDMLARIIVQSGQMLRQRPIADAIRLCAPDATLQNAKPAACHTYVVDWARARIWRKFGASTPCGELYDLYVKWCGEKEQQILPVPRGTFEGIVRNDLGVDIVRCANGGREFLSLALRPDWAIGAGAWAANGTLPPAESEMA